MDTLRPIVDFDGSKPLLALDVDGCVNFFPDDWDKKTPPIDGAVRRLVRTAHGEKLWIDYNPDVIDALDELVRTGVVELGWNTTWGPNVRALVEQAFHGKLSGGFVLAKMPPKVRGRRPKDWKLAALRARVGDTVQSWLWVDDEDVPVAWHYLALGNDPVLSAVPGLAIAPRESVGLTMADIDRMRAFLAAGSSRAASA